MSMVRERIIRKIESVEQALKVEESIETGYCSVIKENLEYWIAVEEDLIDSYKRLSEKYTKDVFSKLIQGSEKNLKILKSMLNDINKLLDERNERKLLLKSLE